MEIEMIEIKADCCRCCLSPPPLEDQLDKIFECVFEEESFQTILQSIAPIVIYPDDVICENCKFSAIQAFNFRKSCIASDLIIRSSKEVSVEPLFKNLDEEAGILSNEVEDSDPEFLEETEEDESSDDEDADFSNNYVEVPAVKSNKKYQCFICSKEFPTPSKLLRHKIVHRDILDPSELPKPTRRPLRYSCNFCGKQVETPSKLERHLRVHNKKDKLYTGINQHRPYACDFCDKRFWDVVKLERHQIIHSKDVELSAISRPADHLFTCVICLNQFSDFDESIKHMKTHRENAVSEKIDAECKLCAKKYSTLANLIRHSLTHPENATHQCCHCSKLFGFGDDFLEHMLRHQGFKPFACDHPSCGKSFIKLHKLRAHKLCHEVDLPKPFVCDQCDKKFSDREYLKRHIMRHSGEKPHVCNLCHARFTFKSGLTSHMATHKKQKKFSCDVCKASFTKKQSLNTHQMIHTGDKRFKCNVCEMGFTTSGHLLRHSRTHSGFKPYQCKYCEKSYGQSNDLMKHLKSHLGEKVYQCDFGDCQEGFPKCKELKQHKMEHFRNVDLIGEEIYNEDLMGVA